MSEERSSEIAVCLPELERLRGEFLKQFPVDSIEEDVIKKARKVLKGFKEVVCSEGNL